MDPTLFDIVRCPKCQTGRLDPGSDESVRCADCGQTYPVVRGVLDLLWEPSVGAQKEVDAQPVEDAQCQRDLPEHLRHYLEGESGVQLALASPRCPIPELAEAVEIYGRLHALADDYFELLDWLALTGTETVVEVGADSCWSAAHLARDAGTVVATDVSPHLEFGQVYLDNGDRFERVRSEMARFPFREQTLDLIFTVATIHHTHDLDAVFRAFHRALKPGGRAVLFEEPVRSPFDKKAQETFGADRLALGFQEHIYTIGEYFRAARHAGFQPAVIPLPGLLEDPTRRWPHTRRLGLAILDAKLGHTALFTRHIYPLMLQFYPRIPFPRFALLLRRQRSKTPSAQVE